MKNCTCRFVDAMVSSRAVKIGLMIIYSKFDIMMPRTCGYSIRIGDGIIPRELVCGYSLRAGEAISSLW